MDSGVTILLLIVVLLVVGGIALALYGTGGLSWLRKADPRGDHARRHGTGAAER